MVQMVQQLGTITSPLCQRSAILEIILWTQNTYCLLYQPGHKGALFAFKSERKSTKKMHPCVKADTEDWDTEETLLCLIFLIKLLFLFYFRTKSILVAS